MGFLLRKWIWLKRFRKRRGYGVHSPFAFNFLTSVVYEQGSYYAYRELEKLHGGKTCGLTRYRLKCRRLLFRLANYVQPDSICLYGCTDRAIADYLQAGCCHATIQHNPEMSPNNGHRLIYIAENTPPATWEAIATAGGLTPQSATIICDIHRNNEAKVAWETIKRHPSSGISFDLYDYGIVFYDLRKAKQHYITNFYSLL